MALCMGDAGGGGVLVRGRDGRGSGACFGGGAPNLETRGSNAVRYVDHALSNGAAFDLPQTYGGREGSTPSA